MSVAVSPSSVAAILASVRIDRIGAGLQVPRFYSGFTTESLIRTHLLPYLIQLKSERALGFELAERPELQSAVELVDGKIPSRATLWHFRQPSKFAFFSRLMARSLAIMAADAKPSGTSLPFVAGTTCQDLDTGSFDVFTDPETAATIWIQVHPPARRRSLASDVLLLPGFEGPVDEPAEKKWLYEWVDFPIVFRRELDSQVETCRLTYPEWLESPYGSPDLEALFGKGGKNPYTACNVLLLRHLDGQDEILLCKRLRGSGINTYSLPGGKKNSDESITACIRRELKEELGIDYIDGYPVSLRITNVVGYPRVKSVGIVATKWSGTPSRKEYQAHSDWRWYKTTDLPSPLFFPTEMAISDYLADPRRALDWATVEPDEPLPLWNDQSGPNQS